MNPDDLDDEIDLRELFNKVLYAKKIVIIITTLVAILSIIYSIYLPNIYRSSAVLAPSQESDSLAGAMQNLGGLAGLAGINLGLDSGSVVDKAIEVMVSRQFFIDSILPKIYLPDLMADPRWDPNTNKLSYNDDLYDTENDQWVRDVTFPLQVTPSSLESYDFFIENTLSISRDNITGFITVSIDHVSPIIAKNWASNIIYDINEYFRERDRSISSASVDFLNLQISQTNVVEVKQALSGLLQNQIQKYMLTDANEDYVFFTIDPPVAPELKNSPSRSSIVIITTFLGGLLSAIGVILFGKKESKKFS